MLVLSDCGQYCLQPRKFLVGNPVIDPGHVDDPGSKTNGWHILWALSINLMLPVDDVINFGEVDLHHNYTAMLIGADREEVSLITHGHLWGEYDELVEANWWKACFLVCNHYFLGIGYISSGCDDLVEFEILVLTVLNYAFNEPCLNRELCQNIQFYCWPTDKMVVKIKYFWIEYFSMGWRLRARYARFIIPISFLYKKNILYRMPCNDVQCNKSHHIFRKACLFYSRILCRLVSVSWER